MERFDITILGIKTNEDSFYAQIEQQAQWRSDICPQTEVLMVCMMHGGIDLVNGSTVRAHAAAFWGEGNEHFWMGVPSLHVGFGVGAMCIAVAIEVIGVKLNDA